MSYTAEHKAQTRARIVAAARALFNRRGFADVSIDEIMDAAGLTRGGFYNHFARKDELYTEAVTHVLNCNPKLADGMTQAREIVAAYLSDQHLADLDGTCPLIAFSSDAARGSDAVRRAYSKVLSELIAMLQHSLCDRADARQRAVIMATLCVGGMLLARAVDEPSLSDEIRQAALGKAFEVVGEDRPQRSKKRARAM